MIELIVEKNRNCNRNCGWIKKRVGHTINVGLLSTGLSNRLQICPVLLHQEVSLSSHFHAVDSLACLNVLPVAVAARLLTVVSSRHDASMPIGVEDAVQDPVCTFHVLLLNQHRPGSELQMFSCGLVFQSSFFRTYRLQPQPSL